MGNTVMTTFLQYLVDSLLYQQTGNDVFDEIVYWSSFICEILAAIGVVILILKNEPVRKRQRPLDRLIFWECVMVFCENLLQISLVPLSYVEDRWADYAFFAAWTINEVLYLLIILQWLVCVDYCIYGSSDHLKRHYRKAVIPIVVIAILDMFHTVLYSLSPYGGDQIIAWAALGQDVLHVLKLMLEAGYILTAVYVVRSHSKQSREPVFLHLGAFIIPFVFGALFRFYDASFVGFGIILTYAAIKRRDKYIDHKTGLYNPAYLDRICRYWDKKDYKDGSALFMSSAGHADDLSRILGNIRIPGSFNICMGEGKFVLITGFLRKSALKMAEETIMEDARENNVPFEPEILQMRRDRDETMAEFGVRIKETCRGS